MTKTKSSDRPAQHYFFLLNLINSKNRKQRMAMINQASRDELAALADCAATVLDDGFKMKWHQKKRLKKHLESIQKLSRARSTRTALRHIQRGEGLYYVNKKMKFQHGGAILPLLIPVVEALADEGIDYLSEMISGRKQEDDSEYESD